MLSNESIASNKPEGGGQTVRTWAKHVEPGSGYTQTGTNNRLTIVDQCDSDDQIEYLI